MFYTIQNYTYMKVYLREHDDVSECSYVRTRFEIVN